MVDSSVPWQQDIGIRAALIREKIARSLQEAQEQLAIWESETMARLGLLASDEATKLRR
jgi:hypothetical protein